MQNFFFQKKNKKMNFFALINESYADRAAFRKPKISFWALGLELDKLFHFYSYKNEFTLTALLLSS